MIAEKGFQCWLRQGLRLFTRLLREGQRGGLQPVLGHGGGVGHGGEHAGELCGISFGDHRPGGGSGGISLPFRSHLAPRGQGISERVGGERWEYRK